MLCLVTGMLFLLIAFCPIGAQGACNSLPEPNVKTLTVAVGATFTFRISYNRCLQNGVWSSYTNPNLANDPSFTVTVEQDSSLFWSSTLSSVANVSKIGQYYFTIYNSNQESFSQTFTLIIETPPQVSIMPMMKLNAVQGDNASLVCTSFSSPVTIEVIWYFNGVYNFSLHYNSSLHLNNVINEGTNIFTSTLLFQPLQREHEGHYFCSAYNSISNSHKFTNSSDVFVSVYFAAYYLTKPPTMIQELAGGNISLFCSVTANPLPPVVYWLTSNGLNLTNISTSVVASPKVIESTLTLENLQLSHHELNYSCVVEQVIPSNNNRTLLKAQTQLLITHPPQVSSPIHNVTVNVSDEVTLSCEGFGNPRPVIEWYFTGKDGNEVQIHNASRSLPLSDRTIISNLTLTNVTIDQEGSYRCKGTNNVTNLIGSKEDTSIHLTVQVPPIVSRVNSSSNYSLLVNESITLSFSVSSASPPVKIEQIVWTLTTVNGEIKELKSSSRHNFSLDHLTLTICSLSLEYNGLIEMTATNEAGISKKSYFLFIGTVPEVYTPPKNTRVAIGTHNASFTCSSSGHPIPLLTWYVNGQELSLSQDKYSSLYTNTNGTSVLTLFDLGLSDAARYTCLASNVFGNDTVDNHLVVQVPPNVTLTPSQVTVSVNESLQLVCTSYGIPSVVLTWYFGISKEPLKNRGGVISISQKIMEYNDSLIMTTSILTIENITNASWQGVFICEGFNGVTNLIETPENDTSEVIIPIPPKLNVVGSNNLTAVLSRSLTLTVSLSISSPPVTLADIMWSFTNESGCTASINNSEHYQFSTNLLTLTINNVSYSDEGTYEVSVSTTVGNDSAVIAVDVQTPPIALSHFKRIDVLVGHNVSLFCEATSEPIYIFQWKFNGNLISKNDMRYSISDDQSREEYGQLIITNASPSDAGEYTCTVSNVHGVANITVILDILVPPVLQYQPKSEPPYVDHSYNISVRVTSIPNPPVNSSSIAFKRIDDASLSQVDIIYDESIRLVNISFTNISVSDTGTYQLTVKNLAGEDTVDNISLNVKALPLIFTSSRSILLNESESTLLECKADGLPPPSITWLANRRQIGGLSSTFTITTVATDSVRQDVPTFTSRLNATDLLPTHNGSYECVVENQEGTARIQYNISVIPKNFCVSNPCRNGGTCSSGTSSYRCSCTEQWTGKNCDKPATPPAEPYFFASYNRTFYHEFGSTVLLSCPVTGYPQPNIIWFKDDVLLVGAITEDYEIKKLDLNTRGIYRCEATNELGSIKSDNMTVKIKGLVQYLITVKFSKEFIDNFFGHETRRRRQDDDDTYKATEERLNALIGRVESDLMVLLKENNSLVFEFVSMVHHGIATSLLQPIQLLLTILSDTGGSDLLKSIVEDSFNKLKQKLAMAFETDGNPFSSTVARFDGCTPATTVIPSPNGDPNLDFAFPWPETDLSQLITLRCPCGPEGFDIGVIRNATRKCGGNFENGAVWESPIDEACNFSTSARELCALASLEEPVEVLTGLDNITASTEDIGSLELSISTVFVENLTTIVRGDRTFTETFLTVTDNLLSINENAIIESNEEARTSGRLLQSFEGVVDDIPVKSTDKNTIILRTKFAVTVQELNTNSFDDDDSLIFSVTNNTKNFSSANSVSFSDDLNDPSGQIVIPGSILMNVTLNSTVRLTQTAFDTDALFLRRNSLLMKYSYLQVGSILVSASFVDYNISNQEDLINITMKKDKIHHINAICSYWNYTADDYYGNWSNYGCSVLYEDSDIVICGCNHLTTFALLLDVSPEDDPNRPPPFTEFATALTFIGCAVSILCLVLIILTYSIEKRLRNTNNGKLLINMSCALVGLYVSFIPASYAAPIEELCVVVGAFLHYFSLATFLSMASEATILYVELVKVFASGKGNMIMKAILVTWVTPFFLVVLTLAPDYKNYVYDRLCRPKDWQYWIGYIGPFSVIYIYNWIMFLIIIISLSKQQCKMKSQTGNANLGSTTAKQLMLMITLSVLFGLGWGLGLASTSKFPIQWLRYSFEVAFIIAVTFQGLFIFILYGIKVVKVRKTWLKWFYLVTVQREKAQKVEYSLKSTSYSMRQSSKKLKAMTYSLGTYDSGNVELKKVNHQSQFNSMSPSPEPADKPAITDSTVKKLLILEEGKLKTEKLANGCKSEDLDNKSGQA